MRVTLLSYETIRGERRCREVLTRSPGRWYSGKTTRFEMDENQAGQEDMEDLEEYLGEAAQPGRPTAMTIKELLIVRGAQVLFSYKMSSARDRAILNSILNPFLPIGTDFDTEDPVGLKDDVGEYTKEVAEARKIERFAVELAEKGKVQDAIRDFSRAVTIAPHLPSLFNNRAQAYRLAGDTEKALLDLDQAISLSEGKGKSACQAFCQRGLIHRKNGDDAHALSDFKRAADLGSGYAKMALIQMNPYAALCNQMLSQIMEKLQNGSGT